jgi:hypothetical protein
MGPISYPAESFVVDIGGIFVYDNLCEASSSILFDGFSLAYAYNQSLMSIRTSRTVFVKLILNLLILASLKNKNMIEISSLSEINSNSISNFIGVISWGVSAPITRLAKFR